LFELIAVARHLYLAPAAGAIITAMARGRGVRLGERGNFYEKATQFGSISMSGPSIIIFVEGT
jgi:hypothetical protein